MNQLAKSDLISENILDKEFYFQSLFQEACRIHLLTDSQIERIQLELIELMAKEVERYTNDESSSIPVEKAQDLLQSITYSIGIYLKSIVDMTQKIDLLRMEKISVIFYQGMDTISSIKAKAKLLHTNLKDNNMKLNNYAYQDTITDGIGEFFHDYNIEFGAHNIPGCIDYPLLDPLTGLLGVEYIYEYLHRFTLEHNFLKHFSKKSIDLLLHSFDQEAEHMLINIAELVLTNAIGCKLLDQNILELDIQVNDRKWLQNTLQKLSNSELFNKLESAFEQIASVLELEQETAVYLKSTMLPLLESRFRHNLQTNTLEKLLFSFAENRKEELIFEDGIPMEDDKLRELIEKIRDYSSTSEKVAVIRETVRSFSDLIELLEECFYGEEFVEVFQSLSETELSILKKSMKEEAGPEEWENYQPEKEWQQMLKTFASLQ